MANREPRPRRVCSMMTDEELIEECLKQARRLKLIDMPNRLQQVAARLSELSKAQRWRPIEEAPERGPYLVLGGEIESELDDGPQPVDPEYPVTKVSGRQGSSFAVADTCFYSVAVHNPTHFRPIPDPPKNEGGAL